MEQTTTNNGQLNRPDFELLADYVDGLVDHATQERIAQWERDSEEVAMIVSGIRQFYALKGHDREQLDTYLDQLGARWFSEQKQRKNPPAPGFFSQWGIRLAASLLILVAAGVTFFLLRPQQDPLSLSGQYLSSPYQLPAATTRSEGSASGQDDPFRLYGEGKYDQAIQQLEYKALDSRLTEIEQFVLGLCYLYAEQGSPFLASETLDQVVQTGNPLLIQQARWYRALAYLRAGQWEWAQKSLEEILADTGHYRYDEAKKLLDNWERLPQVSTPSHSQQEINPQQEPKQP